MIIVTGAAGFIGSCLIKKLNIEGHNDLVLVDDFSFPQKNKNLENKIFHSKIERSEFLSWFNKNAGEIDFVFHLGARTDTTEKDTAIFDELNLNYSKKIGQICSENNIPLIYASSAATYGLGEHGYIDSHDIVDKLKPLNPYGVSKNDFDKWVLRTQPTVSNPKSQIPNPPPFWAGLKFFNVYGPNEYHKGRMASVIYHTVNLIRKTGGMKLFRSHRPDIADGHQSRDFIYVKDVVDVIYFFYKNRKNSGLYNVGTGQARTFLDLATNTFKAMDLEPNISFTDTPEDIRGTYQYFTEADMSKLRAAGYDKKFYSLEEGVEEYVREYLRGNNFW
ncbi:MAG TPA: ADP-glyceromanno-heptose 6-epimerase [Bacteroidetes bacterium]|nr:ADP-glyceromanno-heptose 6-epimerase [Bacteroidota bacterium]